MWKYLVSNTPNLSKSGYEFKMIYSYEKRKEETKRLKTKYPNKIPTIIEKSNTAMLQKMDKQKFLFDRELTVGQIIYLIRQKIKLDPTQTIFLFVDNKTIPPTSVTIGEVYDKDADEDGFLYVTYCTEVVFG